MEQLTENEIRAKEYMKLLFDEAEGIPCDTDLSTFKPELPKWYDAAAYKRGQQYFLNNRAGIFSTNMIGLLALLAHHKGLQVLACTGRSSTSETAKKRYVSTVLHTLSWYEEDLYPGSKSWNSLMRVRKLHLASSRLAESKKLHFISQGELTITQFGFMGLALIRPHLFGIRLDNEDDQKAFVHVWAVIGYMLGIHDKFNMCLLPFDVVKLVCHLHLRYLMIPALQLDCPEFKKMTKALLEGLSQFFPMANYDSYIFFARYAVGVPGYQYKADLEKEVHCRSILTDDEMKSFLEKYAKKLGYEYIEFVLFRDIPVFNVIKHNETYEVNGNEITYTGGEKKDELIINGVPGTMDPDYAKRLRKFLGVEKKDSVSLRLVNYETEWSSTLNDSKYYELDAQAQRVVSLRHRFGTLYEYRLGRYLLELMTSFMLYRMRKYLENANKLS